MWTHIKLDLIMRLINLVSFKVHNLKTTLTFIKEKHKYRNNLEAADALMGKSSIDFLAYLIPWLGG